MGELELALEMTDYALRSLGVAGGTLASSSRSGCARRKSHGQSDSTSANSTNCAV